MTLPHCASGTVIHSRVLGGHGAQLQGELVVGCVSSDGDAALESRVVAGATRPVPHPLQPSPRALADPVPVVTAGDRAPGDNAGQREGLRRLHKSWAGLLKCELT